MSGYNENPSAELYIGFINERLRLLREAKVNLHVIDIRDYHLVSHTLTNIKPDVVIHLAAIAHANRSNKDPYSTFDHSFRTLENVLDATRDLGVHVIYLSSSMVYGDFDGEAPRAFNSNRKGCPLAECAYCFAIMACSSRIVARVF